MRILIFTLQGNCLNIQSSQWLAYGRCLNNKLFENKEQKSSLSGNKLECLKSTEAQLRERRLCIQGEIWA